MKIVSEKDFENEIKEGVVLVDFFATWCGPCRVMSGILEELDGKEYKIIKVDTDESFNLAKKFGIMSIPTLIIFKDGQMQEKHIGVMSKEDCEKILKKYI